MLQWNSRSLNPKIPDLQNLLHQKSVDIACISETWRNDILHKNIKIPCYSLIEFTSQIPASNGVYYNGVAIVVKKDIPFVRLPIGFNTHPFQIVACNIKIDLEEITVFSIYVPPNLNYSLDQT